MEKTIKIQNYKSERTLYLTGEITEESTSKLEEEINNIIQDDTCKYCENIENLKQIGQQYVELYMLENKFPPIRLVVSSLGGDVRSGLGLYNFIKHVNDNTEHNIEIEINGAAASMATIIMLASDKRICGKDCSFMIHSIWSSEWYAKVQEQRDNLKETERLNNIIWGIYLKQTKMTEELLTKIEKEKIDYWIGTDEALKLGLITDIF
jgi:ATP-dependent protease ClpP protease subunit